MARVRRRQCIVASLAASMGPWPAWAQPAQHPLRIVTSFATGGASDAVARAVAEALRRVLDRPTLVDPRPGADGVLAANAVAAAAPDGATLLLGSSTALIAVPGLRKRPPYDPFTAFTPVCRLGRFQMALLVHAGVNAHSVAELLRLIDCEPGALAAASSNSTAELALRQLLATRRVVHVPYKGDALALTDLVAGRVQLMVATGANAAPFIADGRLRALATTAPGGGLALEVDAWLGLFAPAGTAVERREALARAVHDVMTGESTRQRLATQGFEPEPLGPAAFDAYFRTQYGRFLAAARRIGMTLER